MARFSTPILLALTVSCSPLLSQTVAVLPFRYVGSDAQMREFVSNLPDMLSTDLSESKRISVVERGQIGKVLSEIGFESSGYVDESTAARAGRLLGANYVVLGAASVYSGAARIDARVVDVETGRVSTSAKVEGQASQPFAMVTRLSSRLLDSFTGEQVNLTRASVFNWQQQFAIVPQSSSNAINALVGAFSSTTLFQNADPPFEISSKILTTNAPSQQVYYPYAFQILVNDEEIATVAANREVQGLVDQKQLRIDNGIYLFTLELLQLWSTDPPKMVFHGQEFSGQGKRLVRANIRIKVETLQ